MCLTFKTCILVFYLYFNWFHPKARFSHDICFQDHKGPVTCAKFNHNTSAIASGSETGEIIVYNVVTGQGCRPLVTPQPQVISFKW